MDFTEALHAAKNRRSDTMTNTVEAGKAVLARKAEHVRARILADVADAGGDRVWPLLLIRTVAYAREYHPTGLLICRHCWTRADADRVEMVLECYVKDQEGFTAWFRAFVTEHFAGMHLTVSVKDGEWGATLSLPPANTIVVRGAREARAITMISLAIRGALARRGR